MTTPIARIFNSLEGSWSFYRTISNFGTVKGQATFKGSSKEENLLLYREDGELTTEHGSNKVYREYLYRYQQDDDKISAYFEKDKLFHSLKFTELSPSPKAQADHACVRDLYNATYKFLSMDEFELTYSVTGPKKNYTMITLFQRLKDPHK